MISLYVTHYNFVRPGKGKATPAMKAGLADHPYDLEWIASLVEAQAPKPKRPKSYRQRASKAHAA